MQRKFLKTIPLKGVDLVVSLCKLSSELWYYLLQVARCLLAAGADVDAVRDTLATPLHAAASVGDRDLITLLLEVRPYKICDSL